MALKQMDALAALREAAGEVIETWIHLFFIGHGSVKQ